MTTFCGVTPYAPSRFYDRSSWILIYHFGRLCILPYPFLWCRARCQHGCKEEFDLTGPLDDGLTGADDITTVTAVEW